MAEQRKKRKTCPVCRRQFGGPGSGRKGPAFKGGFCFLLCAKEAPPRKWTPELAYLTGLLASDGCLEEDKRDGGLSLSMVSTEPAVMETVRRLLAAMGVSHGKGSKGKTKAGTAKERLAWRDYPTYNAMLAVGLTPAKSNTLGPLRLPGNDAFWLVLRGVIDGDGSVLLRPGSEFPTCVRVVGNSRPFLEWLRRQLHLRGVYGTTIIDSHKRKTKAKILAIQPEYIPLLRRRMYEDWDGYSDFALLGHPEKRRRLELRRFNLLHRAKVTRRTRTQRRMEAALLFCRDVLGRWPSAVEYHRVRALALPRLEEAADFPSVLSFQRRFGDWKSAVESLKPHLDATTPLEVLGLELDVAAVERRGRSRSRTIRKPGGPRRERTYAAVLAAMAYCHSVLGRWPNSGEYERLRTGALPLLKDKRLFPSEVTVRQIGAWEEVVKSLGDAPSVEPLRVPGPLPAVSSIVMAPGPRPHSRPERRLPR